MFSTSSTASSSIAEPPRRMFVPTWTWTKPSWPQSELSCGRELEALDGSHKCWGITGPVFELSKSIYGEVKSLLDLRSGYLIERERIIEPVLFGIYMTGRRKEEANPTLLFSCSRIQPRKRAKEVVKESKILQDHPAIRLAHSKRPPQVLRPFRILVGPSKVLTQGDAFGEVYCISPVDRTCGVPVVMRRKDGSFRKATIGGIVQLDETFYGLTVAHTFVEDTYETSESDEDFLDLECSFDSDEDSPRPDERERANQLERAERVSSHEPGTDKERELSSFGTKSLSRALQYIDEEQANSSLVGSLFQYSTHTGLDWALIEIDNNRVDPKTCNAITITNEYEQRTLWPRTLVTTGPAEREVFAITGDKGVIRGTISQSSIYMRTAQTRTFQELWTVHMKSDLVEGDCGSWVVDRENGQLYGQIVAGHPGTGVGYIIPASQIFESVWETLGDALILPSGISSTSVAPILQHADLPGLWQIPKGYAPPSIERQDPHMSVDQTLIAELEFLFSHQNLTKDFKLREHMDDHGFISVPVLASFLKAHNTRLEHIHEICQSLFFLECARDETNLVRKRHGWADYVLPYAQRDQSLKSRSSLAEVAYSSQQRLRAESESKDSDYDSRIIASNYLRDNDINDEGDYSESYQARRKVSKHASSKEATGKESNRGKEPRAAIISDIDDGENDKAIAKVLQRNEKDARRSERQRDPSPVDTARPVYTRMARRHLSLETLRAHMIDFEVDQADPDYVLVKRRLPESEQEDLWEHTRRIRSLNLGSRTNNDARRREYQPDSTSKPSTTLSEVDSISKTTRSDFRGKREHRRRDSDRSQNPSARFPPLAPQQPLAPNPAIFQPSVALPPGWISHFDESTARPYYIHVPTQAVQWEFPAFVSMPQPSQGAYPSGYGPAYGTGISYGGSDANDERTRVDHRPMAVGQRLPDDDEAMRQRLRDRQLPQRRFSTGPPEPSWADYEQQPGPSESRVSPPISNRTNEVAKEVELPKARPSVPEYIKIERRNSSNAFKSSGKR